MALDTHTGSSLAEALFGKPADHLWQDAEIRFDSPAPLLQPRRGEDILETFDSVEDTKGNNGEPGELVLTNLRAVWRSKAKPRTNISVGLNTITSISVKPASSRLKGSAAALYVLTRTLNQQRFEFIFTPLAETSPSLPLALQALLSAYEASRLYRELKLRGALLAGKELRLLPRETAYSRVNGVSNLSSETGNLGTFIITNVRLVWHSISSPSFNVSIPYLQVKSVRVCPSKFGPALVIESSAASGSYVLGFKIDPKETLDYVHKELSSLLQAFTNSPLFGVEYDATRAIDVSQHSQPRIEDETEVTESDSPSHDAWCSYYADGGAGGDGGREPVFSAELGLAVEAPRDGASMQQLWSIL